MLAFLFAMLAAIRQAASAGMPAVLERRHPLQKRSKVLGGSANIRLDSHSRHTETK